MTKNRKRSKKQIKKPSSSKARPSYKFDRATFEALETRQLLAVVSVADFGANPNDGHDDRAAIQAAIDASAPGDTIKFGAGRYDVGGTLSIRSDRTYSGAGSLDTKLQFNVGNSGWGMKIQGNAKNVTIDNFKMEGGGINLGDGSGYQNIQIKNNDITKPAPNSHYSNGPAIFQGVRSDGLVIDGNRIHGYDKYGMILFSVDRLRVVNNTFENLHQGAHILDPGKDNVVSFNKLSGLVRMGFEIQRHGTRTSENLTVEGNVITNWRLPYRDSFGLSIVPDGSVNTRVINNYIQGVPRDHAGPWHPETGTDGQGKRMGYGIEYGAKTGEISGNIIGGAFANHIIVSGGGGQHNDKIPVRDNKLYGSPVWGAWITTESHGGPNFGFTDTNNIKDQNYNNMPKAPAGQPNPNPNPNPEPEPNPNPNPNPNPEPNPNPNPNPQPLPTPPADAPSQVKGLALSTSSIKLTWQNNSKEATAIWIERRATHGSEDFARIATLDARATMFLDTGLNLSWEYDYRVVSVGADDTTSRSGQIAVMTLQADPQAGDANLDGAVDLNDLQVVQANFGLNNATWDQGDFDGDGVVNLQDFNILAVAMGDPNLSLASVPIANRAPNAVDRLQGYALSTDQIRMIWQDTNRNELGYRVERRATHSADDWATVTTLPAGSKVFVDKRLNVGWEYDYRIVAINSFGETVGAAITVQTDKTPNVGSTFVHLNTMKWSNASNGLGPVEINTSNGGSKRNDGGLIAIDGQGYFRGFGVHSNSEIRFTLDGNYKTFLTDIGLDDRSLGKGSVIFQVWADGEMLFDSGTVKGIAPAQSVEVPVEGRKELWLVVTDAGDGTKHDMANWANPRLAA